MIALLPQRSNVNDPDVCRCFPPLVMDQRPFHTIPYEEFLERLRALTNLRVVPEEESSTGYGIDIGPFPGWETVPEW